MIVSIAKNALLSAGGQVSTSNSGTPQLATLGSPTLGNPTRLTIGFEVDAATTITAQVSYDDGQTWLQATLDGSSAAASVVFAAAGGQAMSICPAPYVRLISTNQCHITAWAYTS